MPKRILIAGASIAGPALAFWLRRQGHAVTVVERSGSLRLGGQTVDLRGAGREVARRMAIEDDVRRETTHEDGVAFVDGNNNVRAAFGADAFGGEGLVAELEILRGSLAHILYVKTRGDVEYVFGDRVSAVADDGNEVRVGFAGGSSRAFDLVIAADGIRSQTRDLVFGAVDIEPLGMYTAYFTIPRAPSDGSWARWYSAPGSRTITVRPDNLGTTRAAMSFLCPPCGYEDLDQAEQIQILHRVFADAGWETSRVLAALETTPDFYFDCIGQVKMPSWSKGRVAAVGDAAYCPSPISGVGTSLALVGAYVLAGELGRHDGHEKAFRSYEAIMRPYVAQAQKLPPGTPRLANPRTRLGIAVFYGLLHLAAKPLAQRLLAKVFAPTADAIDLPDYGERV